MKPRANLPEAGINPRVPADESIPTEVVLVGFGAISAVGNGMNALSAALKTNSSGLKACSRFDHPRYQSRVVGQAQGINRSEDDPALDLAVEALRQARQQAQAELGGLPAGRIGLVLSTTKANIHALELLAEGQACSQSASRHVQANLLAADLAAMFGAHGPVQTVSLACVSGLAALQQAAKLIQRGAADAVYVVGTDHLSAFVMAGFTALKALDPQGCRPFDRERCGLTLGEAGAAIVLARKSVAPESKLTIKGWGSSNDANHMTGPSRDGSGLALAIGRALDAAGLAPRDIDYINAHGTGTAYNDAMEGKALGSVFGGLGTPVSGSKGMLGHTLGAAGVIETILCALAMQERIIPGTPRLSAAGEDAPPGLTREPMTAPKLEHVLKLNVGFGGVNSALVLRHG